MLVKFHPVAAVPVLETVVSRAFRQLTRPAAWTFPQTTYQPYHRPGYVTLRFRWDERAAARAG